MWLCRSPGGRDVIAARGGDHLNGDVGNDTITAGRDTRPADDVFPDTVSWATSPRAVHIDLATGRVTGDGTDQLVGRPVAVEGSEYNDVILGSAADDRINAGGGDDVVRAGSGDDILSADSGHTTTRRRRTASGAARGTTSSARGKVTTSCGAEAAMTSSTTSA